MKNELNSKNMMVNLWNLAEDIKTKKATPEVARTTVSLYKAILSTLSEERKTLQFAGKKSRNLQIGFFR